MTDFDDPVRMWTKTSEIVGPDREQCATRGGRQPMKRWMAVLQLALVAGAVSWTSPSGAGGEAIAVVVNDSAGAGKLSRDELKSIFQTRTTRLPGGEKAAPVNLPQGDSIRVSFDQAVLGLSPDEVARYWVDRKIRGGNRPPKKLSSSALVIKHVERTPGAIGYVPASHAKGVKVVAKIQGGRVVAP